MKTIFAVIPALLCMGIVSSLGANPKYHVVQQIVQDNSGTDGQSVTNSITTYTYDGEQLIRAISEFDRNRDGVMDLRNTLTPILNADGLRIATTIESEAIPIGRITLRNRSDYEYDEQGRPIGVVVRTDSNADGTNDYISRTTQVFDYTGNLAQVFTEVDSDADGTWDSRTTETRTYDSENRLILRKRESAYNVAGGSGVITITRYTLDEEGNAVLLVSETHFYPDDLPPIIETRRSTFNKRGDAISSITEYDDGDGVIDGTNRTNDSYDPHRNLVRVVEESDFDGDGRVDYISTIIRTYVRVHL